MKPIFCLKCHRPLQIPKFLQQGNIKVESHINLECGFCKHKNKYKPENMQTKEEVQRELWIKSILMMYPKMKDVENEFLNKFGQYTCGIGDSWSWFDKDKTHVDRATGEVKKSFSDTLKEGHTFLQDATYQELIKILAFDLADDKYKPEVKEEIKTEEVSGC